MNTRTRETWFTGSCFVGCGSLHVNDPCSMGVGWDNSQLWIPQRAFLNYRRGQVLHLEFQAIDMIRPTSKTKFWYLTKEIQVRFLVDRELLLLILSVQDFNPLVKQILNENNVDCQILWPKENWPTNHNPDCHDRGPSLQVVEQSRQRDTDGAPSLSQRSMERTA